jgi:hypothetical protein
MKGSTESVRRSSWTTLVVGTAHAASINIAMPITEVTFFIRRIFYRLAAKVRKRRLNYLS